MTAESIRSKLATFDEAMQKLAKIPRSDLETFLEDPPRLDATLRLLQVSIHVLIDLASFVSAKLGLRSARTSQDVLEALESAGHIPAGSADRFRPIFAFRDRVVHLYDRIDPKIVFAILRDRRGELGELLAPLVKRL